MQFNYFLPPATGSTASKPEVDVKVWGTTESRKQRRASTIGARAPSLPSRICPLSLTPVPGVLMGHLVARGQEWRHVQNTF